MKKKIENKKPDWRKYLLYTLSAAMLTAPLFVPGMVRAAEPESEYKKESGQDKEESKSPVSWKFKDGVLTVSGEGEMLDYSGTEEVPWIAVRDSVRKIVIEEGITSIGKQSFSNFENLEEVVFPETLKIIGNGAFFECSSLAQVILPESVERLGAGAFAGCRSLASFSGKGVVIFGNFVFERTALTSFEIPEKTTKVSALTFLGTPVGEYTVQSGNTEFSAKDGVLFNADRSKLEIYPAEKEEKGYQIPEGCTEIGRYAFRDVKNLKSIDLTGVVSLEEGAFYGASLSGKLILPDSLTKLEGGFLFENCTELTSVDFGKGLEETSYRMFENCTAIKQVNAGNHLKKIAARTFTGCDALTEVKLPQSITWADEHAFPDTAKVTCENTELVRFGKNGFHYAEQVSVLGTRDYQMTFQVLSLVNEERKKQGLSPVNMDAGLLQSAMKRAEELSLLFSHTRPDGTNCFSVNQDMAAENIAIGSTNAVEVMKMWMASTEQRENILKKDIHSIGIGCFFVNGSYMWTQLFSEKSITGNCVQPANANTTPRMELLADPFAEAADLAKSMVGTSEKYKYKAKIRLMGGLRVGDAKQAAFCIVNPGFSAFSVPVYTNITWSSGDSSVALADTSGKMIGLKTGNTIIQAKTKYYSASMALTVAEARKDTDDEEEKPDPVPEQKNKILRIGGAKYKVTTAAAKKREVRYMKPIKQKKVIQIPASIKVKGIMYKVTSIAPRAFKGNKKVTSVTIAGSIERIGKRAFYNCPNLKKIIIRTKRLKKKRIGAQAFAKLSKKTVIYVPKRKRKAYKKLLKARGAAKAKIK